MSDENWCVELAGRLARDGYATAPVSDGRVFMFSVDTLLQLLKTAKDNQSQHVALLVRDPDLAKIADAVAEASMTSGTTGKN